MMEASLSFCNIISNLVPIVTVVISGVAALVACLGYKKSNDRHKETIKIQTEFEERHDNQFREQQNRLDDAERASIIPFFMFRDDAKIIKKEHRGEAVLEFPVNIINIGKEAAVNIEVCKYDPSDERSPYFALSPSADSEAHSHGIHDYLSKYYALPGEEVSFSLVCDYHEEAYNVHFRIEFEDLVGRRYQQKIRFQYMYTMQNTYSKNHFSRAPERLDM